jgi:hypothetical protein
LQACCSCTATHFRSWLRASRIQRLQKTCPQGPATGSSGESRHSPHSAPEQSALPTDSAGPAAAAACAAAWAAKSRTIKDLSDSLQHNVVRYDDGVRDAAHTACGVNARLEGSACKRLCYSSLHYVCMLLISISQGAVPSTSCVTHLPPEQILLMGCSRARACSLMLPLNMPVPH